MMDVQTLTPTLSVGGQVSPADVRWLAAQGFRAIVCNRPDGEAPDQPAFAEIEGAARAAGIEARYLPVSHGDLDEAKAAEFHALLDSLPKPVLAYCRSGARSATLWNLGRAAAA